MDLINKYTMFVNQMLEEPRNELRRRQMKRPSKKIQELIDKYDKELYEQYKFIGDLIVEEAELNKLEREELERLQKSDV